MRPVYGIRNDSTKPTPMSKENIKPVAGTSIAPVSNDATVSTANGCTRSRSHSVDSVGNAQQTPKTPKPFTNWLINWIDKTNSAAQSNSASQNAKTKQDNKLGLTPKKSIQDKSKNVPLAAEQQKDPNDAVHSAIDYLDDDLDDGVSTQQRQNDSMNVSSNSEQEVDDANKTAYSDKTIDAENADLSPIVPSDIGQQSIDTNST